MTDDLPQPLIDLFADINRRLTGSSPPASATTKLAEQESEIKHLRKLLLELEVVCVRRLWLLREVSSSCVERQIMDYTSVQIPTVSWELIMKETDGY